VITNTTRKGKKYKGIRNFSYYVRLSFKKKYPIGLEKVNVRKDLSECFLGVK